MKCKLKREILKDVFPDESEEQVSQHIFPEEHTSENRLGYQMQGHSHAKNESSIHKYNKVGSENLSFHHQRNSQVFNEAASVSREEVILKENEIIYLQDEVNFLRQKVKILDEKNTELQKELTDKNSIIISRPQKTQDENQNKRTGPADNDA